MTFSRTRRAFSLIELVIVVVIIGIIAAIAIPRMSRGAEGARDTALTGSLAVIRSGIDLYATEHGALPGAGFVNQMTLYSDINGNTNATKGGAFIYGPYVRDLPALTVGTKKGATAVFIETNAANNPPGGVATDGWWYNTVTGDFRANLPDADLDASGAQYNQY
jgi:general secretion pathway protein G